MQLARAAAARALAAHEQPEQTPPANPAEQPKTNDPDLAFARHSRSVRQSVELWEKITNNAFARPIYAARSSRPSHPLEYYREALEGLEDRPDPPPYNPIDLGNLYEAVATLSQTHPDQAEIHETLTEIIEATLTAHPDDHLSANFLRICQAFDIEPDRHRLQPHLESQLRPPPNTPDRYPKPG